MLPGERGAVAVCSLGEQRRSLGLERARQHHVLLRQMEANAWVRGDGGRGLEGRMNDWAVGIGRGDVVVCMNG